MDRLNELLQELGISKFSLDKPFKSKKVSASPTDLTEIFNLFSEIEQKNEEKLSRTQQLNTVKIQALRELGYSDINTNNASEVFEKIASPTDLTEIFNLFSTSIKYSVSTTTLLIASSLPSFIFNNCSSKTFFSFGHLSKLSKTK